MPEDMIIISEVGNVYELRRNQWRGKVARITKDQELLNEVRKYTWTCCEGKHPYLRCSKLGVSLHKFVLDFVYGKENIDKMLAKGNIIEHLDNDGLNCTYENLHIMSDDMNKAKAFSIDKKSKESENDSFPVYILDVYYLHEKKQFQLQIFMNYDILFTKEGHPIEMLICMYNDFDNLFVDWFYLLSERDKRTFEISKFHAAKILMKKRPVLQDITPEEMNSPFIERDGVYYLNLSAKAEGKPQAVIRHTALRKIESEGEE